VKKGFFLAYWFEKLFFYFKAKEDVQMKKKIVLFFVITLVGVAFITVGSFKSQAAPIKLTYSNFFPPSHIQSKLAEAWCKEVEKRTNGRVKVEYYAGQTLTKAKQCYDGVVTGLSDIGFSVLAYTGGRFPVLSAIDLPLGYTSGKVATAIANDFLQTFNPKEIQDTKVMYLHAHGPGLVHTRDKPVRKLEDLKGLKLRGHGTSAKFQKALGAIPVGKPMPECYQMIQKGVVEGASYPFEANKGWRLAEVTKYATAAFSAAYTTTFFVVMNKDKWNALPADIKKIIEAINKEWEAKHGEAWDSSDLIGVQFFLTKGGTIIGLDSKEAARWEKAVASVADEYIAGMKKKGFSDAKKYVDFVKTALEKYQK
jgi:TRAP-type C4-dicarboxylate transport system substrate-binding protein